MTRGSRWRTRVLGHQPAWWEPVCVRRGCRDDECPSRGRHASARVGGAISRSGRLAGLGGLAGGTRTRIGRVPGAPCIGRSAGCDRIRRLSVTRLAIREAVKARQDEVQRRGRVLGWMSLGLSVAQLATPDTVRQISGVGDSRTSRAVVSLVGARELVHAAGLLTSRRKNVWAWTGRGRFDGPDLARDGHRPPLRASQAAARRCHRRRWDRRGGPTHGRAGHAGKEISSVRGYGAHAKEDRWS